MAKTKAIAEALRHAPKSPYPRQVRPMLASLSDKPFSDPGWLFEVKWDGYRMIGGVRKGETSLTSRNFISYTQTFSPIAKSLRLVKNEMVVDGEVVVVDDDGISDFQLLQNYQKTGEGNILYYIFDMVWFEGRDIKGMPLLERKLLLSENIPKSDHLRLSEHIEENGKALFTAARSQHLEGIVAKRSDSMYYEAIRTRHWLKIKAGKRQEAIICGFTEPRGSRRYFGSLILGLYDNKILKYIGHTGTGFNEVTLGQIHKMLKKHIRKECPFRTVPKTNERPTWV